MQSTLSRSGLQDGYRYSHQPVRLLVPRDSCAIVFLCADSFIFVPPPQENDNAVPFPLFPHFEPFVLGFPEL